MIGSIAARRQAIEVLAKSLAGQEDRTNAKASTLDLGRNEVLPSLILLGLADVTERRLIETPIPPWARMLVKVDLCSNRICCGNRKCNLVADSHVRRKKAGQEKLGLIAKGATSKFPLPKQPHYALTTNGNR
jgi:hypothetical protein